MRIDRARQKSERLATLVVDPATVASFAAVVLLGLVVLDQVSIVYVAGLTALVAGWSSAWSP